MSVTPLLRIEGLEASIDETAILKGINLEILPGEVHAVMGRNGSGKSTTAHVLMGHPDYEVTNGNVKLDGEDLLEMESYERARAGVFLSFQYPHSVPGLQVGNFLRRSVSAINGEEAAKGPEFRTLLKEGMEQLGLDRSFLARYVNDGFSGGEKKRFEILQMMLIKPKLAILDETDSGLDIDGIRTVAQGVDAAIRGSNSGALIITHYNRILEHVKPDKIHVLIDGKIVKSGGPELANQLEERGYDWIEKEVMNDE
ncbi:MAG: Fe-S cluster assembly ATPase SufC [Candidatus Thermoplasmatota archaeon]|nr:Fe-S cluster assembly ATPase SufC [Candidatus Thermoplasmatota archaeon]MEC8384749.1 Fe-S cluster assembly ATPase SufC [Candidatus Thermoplasmatota archaeon]|tara:strand:- start:5637 stop:6404 length:768 start_codon:yes stop_codon:yes gene_type:complete